MGWAGGKNKRSIIFRFHATYSRSCRPHTFTSTTPIIPSQRHHEYPGDTHNQSLFSHRSRDTIALYDAKHAVCTTLPRAYFRYVDLLSYARKRNVFNRIHTRPGRVACTPARKQNEFLRPTHNQFGRKCLRHSRSHACHSVPRKIDGYFTCASRVRCRRGGLSSTPGWILFTISCHFSRTNERGANITGVDFGETYKGF